MHISKDDNEHKCMKLLRYVTRVGSPFCFDLSCSGGYRVSLCITARNMEGSTSYTLHNRTRPSNYKSWLTDSSQFISATTLRSRAAAEERKQQEPEVHRSSSTAHDARSGSFADPQIVRFFTYV